MVKFLKAAVVTGLAAGLMILFAGTALASSQQANGQGQTPLSASLGFNAKPDLTGQLEYNADPSGAYAGFRAHCDGYTAYKEDHLKTGAGRVRVWATCKDENGVTIYMKGSFIDRGEPGTNDSLCVAFSYTDPKVRTDFYVHDMGFISNGNIQVHG